MSRYFWITELRTFHWTCQASARFVHNPFEVKQQAFL